MNAVKMSGVMRIATTDHSDVLSIFVRRYYLRLSY